MSENLEQIIEDLKELAEQMPTTGDMADIDMALMYLRHAKRHLEGE